MRRMWVAYVFLAVLAVTLVSKHHPPLVGADRAHTVLSGSMSPALKPGDLIIVKEAEPSAINIGRRSTPGPKYDKSIDHYKKAWAHAQKELKNVGKIISTST